LIFTGNAGFSQKTADFYKKQRILVKNAEFLQKTSDFYKKRRNVSKNARFSEKTFNSPEKPLLFATNAFRKSFDFHFLITEEK